MRGRDRRLSVAAVVADLAVLVVFVAVGRRSHDEAAGLEGFVRVWWPFAAGLGAATAVTGLWREPLAWRRAVPAWLLTVAAGMALRVTVQGRDLRPSFVVVTTLFAGVGMLGWRAVVRRRVTRRARAAAGG